MMIFKFWLSKLISLFQRKSRPGVSAIDQALEHYCAGELDLCKQALENHLSAVTEKDIQNYTPRSFGEGNDIFDMLYYLDFNNYLERSSERILYLRVFLYLIENAPPDLQKKFDQDLKEIFDIEPAGYADDGEPYFEVANIAKIFNIPEERIIKSLEEEEGDNA